MQYWLLITIGLALLIGLILALIFRHWEWALVSFPVFIVLLMPWIAWDSATEVPYTFIVELPAGYMNKEDFQGFSPLDWEGIS